jgi:hypothetical protein
MKRYNVVVKAMLYKSYTVEGMNEEEACEQAHELFNCDPDTGERYEQDTVSIMELRS